MLSREEIAWAGGLFEGEGCFTTGKANRAVAAVKMTDLGPLQRFHAAVGIGTLRGPYKRKESPRYKDIYLWGVYSFENFQAVVAMLWPFLGERRRARATEILTVMAKDMAVAHAKKVNCPKCGNPYSHVETSGRGTKHRRCRPCQSARQRERYWAYQRAVAEAWIEGEPDQTGHPVA